MNHWLHAVARAQPATPMRGKPRWPYRNTQLSTKFTTFAAMMTLPAALFILAPGLIASIYTSDAAVLRIAMVLVPLAGAFQLFDGTQVVCFGALRGAGDVHVPAIANAVGYWLLGLPVGYWLAFHAGWGGAGIWLGLVIGLAVVAVLLLARVAWIAAGRGVRLRLEEA